MSQWSESIFSLPPFRYLSQYLHVFISDVTVLVPVLKENSHHAFAVYTSDSTKQRWPLILAAQTEKDMADWVGLERLPFRYKQHICFEWIDILMPFYLFLIFYMNLDIYFLNLTHFTTAFKVTSQLK